MTFALPSFDQIKDFISKTETAVAAISAPGSTLGDDVQAALPVAASALGTALDIYFPELDLFGIPASKVLSTVTALANPTTGPASDLSNAFDELKAAVTGGPAPTLAAWKTFDAAADAAHAGWQASVAARRKAGN